MAENTEDLQALTNNVKAISQKSGLDMNVKKTKTMVISRSNNTKANITINNEELEQVDEFKYLGQTITSDAKTEKEIRIRTGIAKSRFQDIKTILLNRRISQDLKFRLIKCFIYSVFTYGCETWTLTRDMENKINAFEMWIFRKVAKIKWSDRISNEEVCKKLNLEKSLLNDIKKRKLCYFGHIKRHSSMKKEILEGKIEGKRNGRTM